MTGQSPRYRPRVHYVSGSFGKQANEFNCTNRADASVNYYVQAYDHRTTTWSNRITAKIRTNVL